MPSLPETHREEQLLSFVWCPGPVCGLIQSLLSKVRKAQVHRTIFGVGLIIPCFDRRMEYGSWRDVASPTHIRWKHDLHPLSILEFEALEERKPLFIDDIS